MAVRTNIINLNVAAVGADAAGIVRDAAAEGVQAVQISSSTVRLVVHMEIDDDAVDHVATVLASLLASRGR